MNTQKDAGIRCQKKDVSLTGTEKSGEFWVIILKIKVSGRPEDERPSKDAPGKRKVRYRRRNVDR